MNELTNIGKMTEFTISSTDIAKACGKQHRNVTRDIEKMLLELGFDVLKFEHIYLDAKNREQKQYLLPKDLAITLGLFALIRTGAIKCNTGTTFRSHTMLTASPSLTQYVWDDAPEDDFG